MIKTFRDAATKSLFETSRSRRLPADIWRSGLRRLQLLDAAASLSSLRGAGNSLEQLEDGRYVIRVNDRYRIVFRWVDGHAYDVEIVDYH